MTKFLDNMALGVVGTLVFLVLVVVLAIFIKFPWVLAYLAVMILIMWAIHRIATN